MKTLEEIRKEIGNREYKRMKLKEYSKKYNGMMVCSCGYVGSYFNLIDDFRWKTHKLFCNEKSIRTPKDIKEFIKEK